MSESTIIRVHVQTCLQYLFLVTSWDFRSSLTHCSLFFTLFKLFATVFVITFTGDFDCDNLDVSSNSFSFVSGVC